MESSRSYLCVGGPKSGERVSPNPEKRFIADILPPMGMARVSGPPDINEPVSLTVERIEYVNEHFVTPEGKITLWVPEGQTPLETLEVLLDTYAQACSAKDKEGSPCPPT